MLCQVNNEWAMEQLRTFIASTQHVPSNGYGGHAAPEEEIVAQAHVVEQIFDRVILDWKDRVEVASYDRWTPRREVAHRALTQLEREQEISENLGEAAPDLNAAHMHPWVWGGAQSQISGESRVPSC